MHFSDKPRRPPLVLIANDQEWAARSLDSLLGPKGFAVVRAHTGSQTLELARTTRPDAVLLDAQLEGIGGLELCRQIRSDPQVSDATPVILISHAPGGRSERLEAYAAGAWDFCTQPLDGEALLLKLSTFIRGKREADALRGESLIDELTGLYSMRGLARRAQEIGAEATRLRHALTCVAFVTMPDRGTKPETDTGVGMRLVAEHVGLICRQQGRLSDAIGRLGQNEFGVVAPSTNEHGAALMIDRLRSAIETGPVVASGTWASVRVSMCSRSVSDFSAAKADAMEMLLDATGDLRRARSAPLDGQALSPY
jgi:diguanylate cyclase (GGDEF)-like protein